MNWVQQHAMECADGTCWCCDNIIKLIWIYSVEELIKQRNLVDVLFKVQHDVPSLSLYCSPAYVIGSSLSLQFGPKEVLIGVWRTTLGQMRLLNKFNWLKPSLSLWRLILWVYVLLSFMFKICVHRSGI